MKKYLIAALLTAAAAISTAEAQTRQSFTAPVGDERRESERRTAPLTRTREAGAIPRGIRGGNPAQMLNPRAPRRYYGTPDDTVTYDQNNPSRITGIILFGLRW